MKKYYYLLLLFSVHFLPIANTTTMPRNVEISQNTAKLSYFSQKITTNLPLTTAEKWKKAGLITLLIVGIGLLILGLVLFVDLAKNGFDGGHLGYIPTLIVAVILGLGALLSVFSGKRLKKLGQ